MSTRLLCLLIAGARALAPSAPPPVDRDPDATVGCSVGWAEYILAGVAAGSTFFVLAVAMLLDRPWAKRIYFPDDEAPRAPQPEPQFYGIGGSARWEIATIGGDGDDDEAAEPAASELLPPRLQPRLSAEAPADATGAGAGSLRSPAHARGSLGESASPPEAVGSAPSSSGGRSPHSADRRVSFGQ